VYSRIIDNNEHTFGVSGKLIRNVLVMYDRETDTLWSQLLGEAVQGPLTGTKLEFLPAFQTTWSDWKDQHPDSRALQKGYYGNQDPYLQYYATGQTGVIGTTNTDYRLNEKEFVIGVERADLTVAFPFSVLNNEPVVNYQYENVSLLIVFNANTGTGVVFNRFLENQTLTFEIVNGLTLKDLETQSIWDGLNGIAIEGPLEGKELERVKSTSSFWFGWVDFYPNTELYGASE
jgi:hypothetical protein